MKRKQITMAQFFALVLAGAGFAWASGEVPSVIVPNGDGWLKQDDQGIYKINTAKELAMFVKIVNMGNPDANAQLMDDIQWGGGLQRVYQHF